MKKVNQREYEGVIKSKNENRLKYTISRICESRMAYYCSPPPELTNKSCEYKTDQYVILWGGEFFAKEFFEQNSIVGTELTKSRIHEFYREKLTGWIKEGVKILVFPNLEGEGCFMPAKDFKIALFVELWEGEQEEWMFN